MALSKRFGVVSAVLGSAAGLLVVLNTTDPTRSIASILLVFLLLYIFFASLIFGIFSLISRATRLSRKRGVLTFERQYYMSITLAFMPVSLLAMQSLHQIRLLDFVLATVLMVLVLFYVYKRTSPTR